MTATRVSKSDGITFPFPGSPALGEATQVAPGVLWIKLPLPFGLDHVNVWAIEDGNGYAIVDTGLYTPDAAQRWLEILSKCLEGRPVTRIFVTHAHEDHVGMAGWFAQTFGNTVWMTPPEYRHAHSAKAAENGKPVVEEIRFYERAGWSDAAISEFSRNYGKSGRFIYPLPTSYRPLTDGEVVLIGRHAWQVVTGSGHSPLHACLYCPELTLLISGDQVLPGISSNVSVMSSNPHDDPLSRWYASLLKLREIIPDGVLVLPAHNACFRGLHARLDYLKSGHDEALTRLMNILDTPKRIVDTFSTLFSREIGGGITLRLATGEALAHLNYLYKRQAVGHSMGADGALRYVRLTRDVAE